MDCFGCHATAAVSRGRAQLDQMAPGVTCESCHGPGAEHIEAIKAGNLTAKRIFNPGRLGPYELAQEFCGACHRSWETVMLLGMKGIGNIRFQPYRLHLSKCYDPEDRRIGCTACHDPHAARRHEPAFYDAKCASCHQSTARPRAGQTGARLAAICRVGTKNCVSCHMPKLEMPGSHFKFTDHNIRVAAPNAPYPD
jgi:hypothetical protein